MFISVIGQYFCGMASVTANSRMIYAFSRDGGLPGSKYWHKINPKTRTPTNAVWLGVITSAVVGALSLLQSDAGVSVAFFAHAATRKTREAFVARTRIASTVAGSACPAGRSRSDRDCGAVALASLPLGTGTRRVHWRSRGCSAPGSRLVDCRR